MRIFKVQTGRRPCKRSIITQLGQVYKLLLQLVYPDSFRHEVIGRTIKKPIGNKISEQNSQ